MTVYQHQGKWRVEIYHKGKKIYRKSGFKNQLEAQIHEKEVKENLDSINTGFMKLCEARLEDLEIRRTGKYFKENLSFIKNLLKRWGDKKQVTRDDVESYLMEVAKKSPSTANKRLRLVKALFNHGINRGWIKNNPTKGIQRYPNTPKKRYIPPIEDIKLVLEVADCEQQRYLLVLIHTAARMREINRLKWEDIHEGYLSLYTRKAKCSDLKETKVPINKDLERILKRIEKTSEYVFINQRTGKPYDHRDKFLGTLCNLAGVPRFTFHCLRHFTASLLNHEGAPITDIQAILGHERTTTTDHYLKSLAGSSSKTIRKMEGLFTH